MKTIMRRALGVTALSLFMARVHISAQPVAGSTNQPTSTALEGLQGTWEGVMAGQESSGKITIKITSNTLHFHRDTNFWFATTFKLPIGTDPKQLQATIKDSADEDSIGKVVVALYQIEDGMLSLIAPGDQELPKSFEAAKDQGLGRYELRKVEFGLPVFGGPQKPKDPKTGGKESPKKSDGAPAPN